MSGRRVPRSRQSLTCPFTLDQYLDAVRRTPKFRLLPLPATLPLIPTPTPTPTPTCSTSPSATSTATSTVPPPPPPPTPLDPRLPHVPLTSDTRRKTSPSLPKHTTKPSPRQHRKLALRHPDGKYGDGFADTDLVVRSRDKQPIRRRRASVRSPRHRTMSKRLEMSIHWTESSAPTIDTRNAQQTSVLQRLSDQLASTKIEQLNESCHSLGRRRSGVMHSAPTVKKHALGRSSTRLISPLIYTINGHNETRLPTPAISFCDELNGEEIMLQSDHVVSQSSHVNLCASAVSSNPAGFEDRSCPGWL